MKSSYLCGAMLVAAMNSAGSEVAERVTVCLENRTVVNNFVLARAKSLVSVMFSEVGLQVEWSERAECDTVPTSILIQLDADAPAKFSPGVLAYALPYGVSGTSVHVFYNRIIGQYPAELTPQLLGH